MPKVVHLTPYYWPHVGGVETHVEKVAAELSARGYDQIILTIQHAPALPLTEKKGPITIYRLPTSEAKKKLSYKLFLWWSLWQHRQLLLKADRIQIHDIFWWLIPLLPFISRRKLLMTFHGYEGNNLPKWNQIFWKRVAEKLTQGSLAIGNFQAQWFGISPTLVSYGGVDVRPRQAVSRKKRKAIFIGRLEPDNGLMNYLIALAELKKKKETWQLDVYGDGPLRKKAEAYAKRHHLKVRFHGFVKDAGKYLATAEVAFASRYLTMIEALRAKTPVIANVGNELQRDYLTMSPFAEYVTITSLPAEIVEALHRPKKVSRAAFHWSTQQTWSQVASLYERLWKASL